MSLNFIIDCPLITPTIKIKKKIINEFKPFMDLTYADQINELKSKHYHHEPKNEYLKMFKTIGYKLDTTNYLFDMVGIDKGIYYEFNKNSEYSLHEFNRINKNEIKPVENNRKYHWVLYTKHGEILHKLLKEHSYIERAKILIPLYLSAIEILYDRLELGGNYFFQLHYFMFENQIELIHLLSFLFKKIIIYGTSYIFCSFFLGEEFIPKSKYLEFKYLDFKIKNIDYDLISYIKYVSDYHYKITMYYLNEEVDKYTELVIPNIYDKLMIIELSDEIKQKLYSLFIHFLKKIKIEDNVVNIKVYPDTKEFIHTLIKKHNIKECLEIGFEYAIISIYIFMSNQDIKLISIDPDQSKKWNNNGKKLIKELNLNKNHTLLEDESYVILPKLLKKNVKFEFVFINNKHKTFDYLLLDFFYSYLLINKGGYIIINDSNYSSVSKLIKYIETNYYDFFKKINSPASIACFKKTKEDTRDWDFHKHF